MAVVLLIFSIMSTIKEIRSRLDLTQAALAEGLGCTQGNIGHYERGQSVPPEVAKKLIAFAASRGCLITYEDIYGPPEPDGGALVADKAVA